MKIGILGGTFDPVHQGHLIVAQAAMDHAALDQVLFIPAGQPRLKQAEPTATVNQRAAMVRLAVDGNPEFQVSEMEAHRPGPTYTVDTLVELSSTLASGTDLFFILGLDVLAQLDHWKDPERVLELCSLLVLERPGEEAFDWPGFYNRIPSSESKIQMVAAPMVDVSATELRRMAAAGESLAGQVPDAVARYIQDHGLYLKEREGRTAS